MEHGETVWHLLTDPAHWQFELVASLLFLLVEIVVIWPLYRHFSKHHARDDQELFLLRKRVEALEIK